AVRSGIGNGPVRRHADVRRGAGHPGRHGILEGQYEGLLPGVGGVILRRYTMICQPEIARQGRSREAPFARVSLRSNGLEVDETDPGGGGGPYGWRQSLVRRRAAGGCFGRRGAGWCRSRTLQARRNSNQWYAIGQRWWGR